MRPQIEARLLEVYPDGYLGRPSRDAYYGQELWRQLRVAAGGAVRERPRFVLTQGMNSSSDEVYELAITEAAYPALGTDWLGKGSDVRTAWLDANGGTYPVLWLRVSLVWPALDCFFNLWQKRGNTGYLDANIANEAPDEAWYDLRTAVVSALGSIGIETLSREELLEFGCRW